MIRIAENYARVKTVDLPVGTRASYIATLPEVGTYTISFTGVVHSGEVGIGFLIRGTSSITRIPPSEDRISFTFEWDASHIGSELSIYSAGEAVASENNHVTFHNVHIARGTQGADIWTPAHADLTPEQIATLPPYGKYKEIKSF